MARTKKKKEGERRKEKKKEEEKKKIRRSHKMKVKQVAHRQQEVSDTLALPKVLVPRLGVGKAADIKGDNVL